MPKKSTLKVGDRVGESTSNYSDEYGDSSKRGKLRYDPENPPEFGAIESIDAKGKILVDWDTKYKNAYRKPMDASQLMLESEIKSKLSILETEFDKVEAEVKLKLQDAAKSIREAQKLAKKTGRNVSEMYNVYGTLYNAMDNAGWRTSSFGC